MKHRSRLCAHGGIKQWGVNYWETYDPVLNWISVSSLIAIASIDEFPRRSIDFVFAFPQYEIYLDVFVGLPLGVGVDGNRVEWVI